MHLVSIRTTCFTQQKQWGLYQNKVNSSLAAMQRPGHWADNCKMVYCYSLRGQEVAAIRRYKSRFMKDSLAYRGSILWNLVNYNDKTTNVNFKELKKRLTTRDTRPGIFQRLHLWRHSSLCVETQSQRLCVPKFLRRNERETWCMTWEL